MNYIRSEHFHYASYGSWKEWKQVIESVKFNLKRNLLSTSNFLCFVALLEIQTEPLGPKRRNLLSFVHFSFL